MNVLGWRHPPSRRKWWLAGFTLIELIVVVVIIAILLAIVAFGHNRFVATAYDTATAENVRAVAKSLVVDLQHREGSSYSMEEIQTVATKVPPLAAAGVPQHLTLTTGEASVRELSVGIDPDDAGRVGLALRSPTGKCVLGRLEGFHMRVGKAHVSPTCGGMTAKDAANLDDPSSGGSAPEDGTGHDGDGNGGNGPGNGDGGNGPGNGTGDDGGATVELAAPKNVTVSAGRPGPNAATVTWQPVPDATGYEVYLDNGTSPLTRVTGPTAVLEGLTEGAHTVTVRATHGSGSALVRGPGTTTGGFTIVCENDMIAHACKIPTIDPGYFVSYWNTPNHSATTEPGETGGVYKSLWWEFTPDRTATYGFYVGSLNYVAGSWWDLRIGTAKDVSTRGNIVEGVRAKTVRDSLEKSYVLEAGTTYYIRVATQYDREEHYVLQVHGAPAGDLFVNAQDIAPPAPGETRRFAESNKWATMDPGETGVGLSRSLWWKITPTETGPYGFTLRGTYASLRIGTAADVSTPGNIAELPAGASNDSHYLLPTLQAGTTYYIRASVKYDNETTYSLDVTRPPANDQAANAAVIVPPAPGEKRAVMAGQPSDGQWATVEPGETGGPTKTLWWKMTPNRTGSYTFSGSWNSLRIGTSNDVTKAGDVVEYNNPSLWGFNETRTLSAGTTYYIRVGSWTSYASGNLKFEVSAQ